jgi:hypothetical protein
MLHTEERGHSEPLAVSIERRATLMRLAGLCGLALSGDALAALAVPKGAPGLLAPDALALTGVLVELIIPTTDTPGALAVGAHRTISHLLQACASKSAQAQFVAGLARIDGAAQAQEGKRFAALKAARQVALLHAIEAGQAPFNGEDQNFFRELKSYTAFAYYTAEVGATRELAYAPVPGGYKGDVPLKKVGRSWALY